jgi:hypothetical protein
VTTISRCMKSKSFLSQTKSIISNFPLSSPCVRSQVQFGHSQRPLWPLVRGMRFAQRISDTIFSELRVMLEDVPLTDSQWTSNLPLFSCAGRASRVCIILKARVQSGLPDTALCTRGIPSLLSFVQEKSDIVEYISTCVSSPDEIGQN